ncbi:MAG: hypothetical protein PHE25_01600 [Candidatus Gracilibacteria bacterium]|nr:hypothetical protein [Candidatus Gracilibacteria bacterium]
MGEFAPAGGTVKMTRGQVRRYIKEMEEKRLKAQAELEKAKLKGELNNDDDLEELDQKIDW